MAHGRSAKWGEGKRGKAEMYDPKYDGTKNHPLCFTHGIVVYKFRSSNRSHPGCFGAHWDLQRQCDRAKTTRSSHLRLSHFTQWINTGATSSIKQATSGEYRISIRYHQARAESIIMSIRPAVVNQWAKSIFIT